MTVDPEALAAWNLGVVRARHRIPAGPVRRRRRKPRREDHSMTKRNPPRTAADRARADLAAAERLRTRTKARYSKADAEYKTARMADTAATEMVEYYRGAVEKLSGGAAVAGESA